MSFPSQRELSTSSNERVRDIVKQTIANLSPAVKPVVVSAPVSSENVAPVARAKPSRARPIKMKVEGISQEYWRATVERALIRVPGVISVTLDTVSVRVCAWRARRGCSGRRKDLTDCTHACGASSPAP